MAARTSLSGLRVMRSALLPLCLMALCTSAHGGAEDSIEVADEDTWRVEEARFRFVYYDQNGNGYQSQAGPGPKGSEALSVYEPMFYIRARQNSRVEHTVSLPIDVITSASTDSVDVLTSASRVNEAVTLHIDSRVQATADDVVKVTYGGHAEEWFYSVFGGVNYVRDLAQDNATVAVRLDGSFDWFRAYGPWPGGIFPPGDTFDTRGSFSGNVEMSQILNATTLFKAGYGATWQKGALLTPWNSVPIFCNEDVTECLARIQERFPGNRLRQTVSGLLTHYLPRTSSTLRLSYRFYLDDFEVRAHTLLGELYQNIKDRALISAHYRLHHQTHVFFWTTNLAVFDIDPSAPRTSDSDLAQFWAHEWGLKLLFHITPPGRPNQHDIDVFFNRYTRTNDLRVNVASIAYGYSF